VEDGHWPRDDNPVVRAPHPAACVAADEWTRAYTREEAAFPLPELKRRKYWPPVGRIDNVHGDRNLFCSCVPVANWAESAGSD
jgi:glycine dehydrogenase